MSRFPPPNLGICAASSRTTMMFRTITTKVRAIIQPADAAQPREGRDFSLAMHSNARVHEKGYSAIYTLTTIFVNNVFGDSQDTALLASWLELGPRLLRIMEGKRPLVEPGSSDPSPAEVPSSDLPLPP